MCNNIFKIQAISDRFICPMCQKKASYTKDVVKCTNISCGIEFPVINNIPILINENHIIFLIEDFTIKSGKPVNLEQKTLKIRNIITKFIPSLSNNLSSKKKFSY
jgi:hypothetical protein